MNELEVFTNKIIEICENNAQRMDIFTARQIIKEINTFLYTAPSNIGVVTEFGTEFPYFSAFHKYWHLHHKEILNLTIDEDACEKVADALHEVYVRTNGKAFAEVYDTNGLDSKDVCRVRLLSANQDFRGSRSFESLSKIFNSDPTIFDEFAINESPEDFVKSIGITGLSQNDKRVQYAKRISQFVIDHGTDPYGIIEVFGHDVTALRNALITYEGAGYGNKKTDMFIRDMVVLGVWKDVEGFDKIDVASDINTIRVALRTGILKSEIPLVSSFLDIFCYQYGYVDETNALAWRRVWEIWNEKYANESIESPCLLDYFIYNVVGKQFCKFSLYYFVCEKEHGFYWHSSQNKTCQICYKETGVRNPAKLLCKRMPCECEEGAIAIDKTGFVRSNMANPNYHQCPFKEICDEFGNRDLMPPKSISIMGQTGWSSAYTRENSGGGGLMA
ncbi:MAG: hypothetical protein IJ435_05000 [Clostridia bacterium]|nr:hypothetical protein [Clostridia bacterium]